jgi:predicted RNase H-like nuclease
MAWVAGVDGCKGGWAVALRDIASGEILVRQVAQIAALLEFAEAPAVIGVDMPIGLLDAAGRRGRDCDATARRLLAAPRASSVLSPPVRPALVARTYEEAVSLNRASSPAGLAISRQCYGILAKIREVDAFMTPQRQFQVREVHPELSFYELNGREPMADPKRTHRGLKARLALLEHAWGRTLRPLVEAHRSATLARDDLVDAMAAAWSAERILAGSAITLPDRPPKDSRGLRMEMVR